MSYVIESGSSRRARQRRRTAITLLIVIGLLVFAFLKASSYFKTGGKAAASNCPTATATGTGGHPPPSQITVNVYNATKRAGLATSTAKVVKDRGFVVGAVANDPVKKPVPQPAVVRFGPSGELAAQVVMTLVAGAAPANDGRADASVDLVLGEAFKEIAAPGTIPLPAATPKPGAPTTPKPAAPTTPPPASGASTPPKGSPSTSPC